MQEKAISECGNFLDFLNKLPLTDLLIGVVIPILAALISYYLAERAVRKKENNRLYIQIELIEKELQFNDKQLKDFISFIADMNELKKALEFPIVFMKDFLVNLLDSLQKIKQNYIHTGNLLIDKPVQALILAQKLKDLENKITELEYKGYADKFLDIRRKEKLSQLIEEREQHIEKLNEIKDRDIYKEFSILQSKLEQEMICDVFEKIDKTNDNFVLAKHMFGKIQTFNEKTNKTKDDVLSLFRDLVIFEIDSNIVDVDNFDQDKFDLRKAFVRPKGIQKNLYDLCERYYKCKITTDKIVRHKFVFESKRWNEHASDFVIINDRKLYILLVDIYEELAKADELSNDHQEQYTYCVSLHEKIQNVISKLEDHESKLSKKCK